MQNYARLIPILSIIAIGGFLIFSFFSIPKPTLADAFNTENKKIIENCQNKTTEHSKLYPGDSIYVEEFARLNFYKKCLNENLKDDEIAYTTGTVTSAIDVRCPELYESGGKIESPREGVTFTFTHEEAKELYPNCNIGTGTVTSANSEVPGGTITSTPTIHGIIHEKSQISINQKKAIKVPIVKNVEKRNPKNEKSTGISQLSSINSTSVQTVESYSDTKEKSKCPQKTILRKGWNDTRVQYAYNISCGDMDFIKTIEAESKFDVNAVGDSGKSFGLCQIHKGYNPAMQKAYRALKSDNEKVLFCYKQYSEWVREGVIKTRLYGYNVRNLKQNKNSFTFLSK